VVALRGSLPPLDRSRTGGPPGARFTCSLCSFPSLRGVSIEASYSGNRIRHDASLLNR